MEISIKPEFSITGKQKARSEQNRAKNYGVSK
jgi:hypothetical protein